MHHLFELALNLVVDTDKRFENDVVDAAPEQIHVDTNLLKVSGERLQTPFVPTIIQLGARVVYVLVILLVDREVCQVRVLGALAKRDVVGLRGKAHQPFIVDVDAPWVHRCDAHVQSQIKLKAVNEERISNVS